MASLLAIVAYSVRISASSSLVILATTFDTSGGGWFGTTHGLYSRLA